MTTANCANPALIGHPSLYGAHHDTARTRVLQSPTGGVVTVWAGFRESCVVVHQAKSGVVCGAYASERSMNAYTSELMAEGYIDVTPTAEEAV